MDQQYNSFEDDKKRFRIGLAVVAAVLMLLAAAAWLGRSEYRHYKERRDQAQAQVFLAKGDYRSALLSAREALVLNPTNVPACRVMAEIADLSHSPAVLDWQKRIVETEPTIENKLMLAAVGLRYQNPPFPLTAQILDELAPVATNLPTYQLVAASLDLTTSRLTDAETHFEAAVRLDPTNRLYELNLAILRLSCTNESQADAARVAVKIFCTDKNLGPQALRSLIADRLAHHDAAAANDYSTQLLATAMANLSDHLQQLGILKQLKSGDLVARLQAVQQLAATNAPAVAAVAAWMQANGFRSESVQWLTHLPANVQTQPPIRLALADGYLQGDEWEKLRDFATQGNWEDLEFLRLAIASRAWSEMDQKQVADSNWNAAISEAGNRFGALITLLGLTEQWKLPSQREELLALIVAKFPQERWAQQALAQLYFTVGKTAELNQLYEKLFAIFPKDESLKNNLAATALLLKTNLPTAFKLAQEVCAHAPNNPDAVSTYAYALHLQGRTRDGVAVLEKLNSESLKQPSTALYYGVLLAALGEKEKASPFLAIAEKDGHLLPEEKQLLAGARGTDGK